MLLIPTTREYGQSAVGRKGGSYSAETVGAAGSGGGLQLSSGSERADYLTRGGGGSSVSEAFYTYDPVG
jgi:hypothetical protein